MQGPQMPQDQRTNVKEGREVATCKLQHRLQIVSVTKRHVRGDFVVRKFSGSPKHCSVTVDRDPSSESSILAPFLRHPGASKTNDCARSVTARLCILEA